MAKLGCEGIVSKRLGSPYRTALGEGQKSESAGSQA
jgi:ATP-dependent DNA ligase